MKDFCLEFLILVGSEVWLLTGAPPQPSPTAAGPQSALESKIEYDRLTAYFDKLLNRTLAALGIIGTVAGILLWKDMRDVKTYAEEAAEREAREVVEDRLKEPKFAALISETIHEKVGPAVAEAANKKAEAVVGPAVDEAVRKNLGPRIEAFRALIEKGGQVAIHAAQLYAEDSPEGVIALAADTESPNPEVSSYARMLLREAAAHFESKVSPQHLNYWSSRSLSTRDAMDRITNRNRMGSPLSIATIFVYMKRRVKWDVETFDIPAAKKWCEHNKSKCGQ